MDELPGPRGVVDDASVAADTPVDVIEEILPGNDSSTSVFDTSGDTLEDSTASSVDATSEVAPDVAGFDSTDSSLADTSVDAIDAPTNDATANDATTADVNDATPPIDAIDANDANDANDATTADVNDANDANDAMPVDAVVEAGCSSSAQCNDGRACTVDTCDLGTARCVHTPNHGVCSDGLDCNGIETCDPSAPTPSGCVNGTPVICPNDDGIACTVEACEESTGSCKSTPDNSRCPSTQFCLPFGCGPGATCSGSADCSDGDACNGVEICSGNICQPGTPIECNDGVACTSDTCIPQTGACSFPLNHARCDDGLSCNGVETCTPTGCVAGTPSGC